MTLAVEAGEPVCEAFELLRPLGGAPVTAAHLRTVSLPDSVEIAASVAAQLVLEGQGGATVQMRPGDDPIPLLTEQVDDEHVAIRDAGATWQPTARKRGQRLTDETLQQVARVYRQARAKGRAPTNAVADEMHVARSTAGTYVGRARDAGFLGPAPRRGMAGEKS